MKILTKRQADSEIVNSLFRAGGTLACLPKERFDLGKYKESIIGRELHEDVACRLRLAWAERRRDKDGPYYAIFCIPNR
jgi:hypothetical protein